MSWRYMRVIVMFDLPMETPAEIRAYTAFRKKLLKEGFLMLQKSVYCKLALNSGAGEAIMNSVRLNKPPCGLVQMMMITEKQFSKIEYVIGHKISNVLDTTERLVIL